MLIVEIHAYLLSLHISKYPGNTMIMNEYINSFIKMQRYVKDTLLSRLCTINIPLFWKLRYEEMIFKAYAHICLVA